ncbi:MAG: lysophospholipid acyltransferase family protein [bacterium]
MAIEISPRLPRNGQPNWFKSFVRGIFWLAFGGCDVQGLENVPSEGPLIVASTHRSYLDPVVLGAFLPRIVYVMAKSELFEKRPIAAFITAFGAFPVNRESVRGSTFRTAIKLLRNNGAIVIFPEGGIVESLGEQGFKGGIGMLARRTGSPILPVYLAGTNTLFSWPEILSDNPWLAIHVGKPIHPVDAHGRMARDQIADRVGEALLELERKHLSSGEVPAEASGR